MPYQKVYEERTSQFTVKLDELLLHRCMNEIPTTDVHHDGTGEAMYSPSVTYILNDWLRLIKESTSVHPE